MNTDIYLKLTHSSTTELGKKMSISDQVLSIIYNNESIEKLEKLLSDCDITTQKRTRVNEYKKEKVKMTTVINWGKTIQNIYFDNLAVGKCFQIDSDAFSGAVYMKVEFGKGVFYQLELATAKLYDPTISPVKEVNVSINIDCVKPELYSTP